MVKRILPVVWLVALTVGGCDAKETADTTRYTQEEIDYFVEVALGSEFGSSTQRIRKWTEEVKIKVMGTPTDADRAALDAVIADINGVAEGTSLRLVEDNPNVEMYFVPESEFKEYEPNYVPTNLGFFWVFWRGNGAIYNARIMITTEGVTQKERSHLIREELTQSLGLMRDSGRYEKSIFYQRWTDVTAYTDLDRTLVEMLYRNEVEPNMTQSEVVDVLQGLER